MAEEVLTGKKYRADHLHQTEQRNHTHELEHIASLHSTTDAKIVDMANIWQRVLLENLFGRIVRGIIDNDKITVCASPTIVFMNLFTSLEYTFGFIVSRDYK